MRRVAVTATVPKRCSGAANGQGVLSIVKGFARCLESTETVPAVEGNTAITAYFVEGMVDSRC